MCNRVLHGDLGGRFGGGWRGGDGVLRGRLRNEAIWGVNRLIQRGRVMIGIVLRIGAGASAWRRWSSWRALR